MRIAMRIAHRHLRHLLYQRETVIHYPMMTMREGQEEERLNRQDQTD